MPESPVTPEELASVDLYREPLKSKDLIANRIIKSGRTAIRRNKASAPLKFILDTYPKAAILEKTTVLDYGCGLGDDLKHIKDLHPNPSLVDGYDPNHGLTWDKVGSSNICNDLGYFPNKYDLVFCTYVLNTLPLTYDRYRVIANVLSKVSDQGKAFFTIRTDLKGDYGDIRGTQIKVDPFRIIRTLNELGYHGYLMNTSRGFSVIEAYKEFE